ncbi:hypothetical protein [Chromobacterium sp. ASV23]|uniref:hypothetical protein n=1 Tax=Chromobacterium sp. ASV23 TaxID=2795110 RepID=UPI0018EC48FE|nr:hypothetical protein [Chromobacterium sp. ASV23]
MRASIQLAAAVFFVWSSTAYCIVSMTVPVSPAEKGYESDLGMGWERLHKFALQVYPDIRRMLVPKPAGLEPGDVEAIRNFRRDFQIGMFFAKQIKLADGQTLFDFLMHCSHGMDAANMANIGFDQAGKPYISLQYFPHLRSASSGEDMELNILFRRDGATIKPESPAFSTSILTTPDYLQIHGVRCGR